MAGRGSRELPGFTGFKGADNTSREDSLPDGALREAENVDFHNDGRVRRREGAVQVHSGSAIHSLQGWNSGGVWAEGENLYFQPGAPQAGLPSALVTGLKKYEPISYSEIGEDLYWSNGQVSGIIKADKSTKQWGLETPDGVPTLAANSVGSYVAGRYQVTITYIDADGRESGAPGPALIELDDNQGIDLSDIPQPLDSNVTTIAVYVSDPNGEVMFHHSDLDDGTTVATLYRVNKGEQVSTLFMDQLPAGHIVRYSNGRLISVAEDVIYYSQPLRYGLCKVHEDYFRSAKRVTLCEPVSDGEGSGFFYADDKRTYYVEGSDPETAQIKVVYPVGAVEGTSTLAPGTDLGFEYSGPVPIWLAKNGRPVAGVPGGQVIVLNDRYVADEFERGASLYREADTIKQILIAVTGKGAASGLKANDTAVSSVHFAPLSLPEEVTITDEAVGTISTPGSLLVGLVSWWALDEGGGNRADSHGSHTLTDNNTVGNGTPKVGADCAKTVAASLEYLSINHADFHSQLEFTFAAWYKPIDTDSESFASLWGASGADHHNWRLRKTSTQFILDFRDDANTAYTITSTVTPIVGQWHRVIIWYEESTKVMSMSVDDETPITDTLTLERRHDFADPLEVGGLSWAGAFTDAEFDEIGYWARILTAEEITELNAAIGYPG